MLATPVLLYPFIIRKLTQRKGSFVKEEEESFYTWTVGHCVKVAVGQHAMLRPILGLQPDSNIGDSVIEAGEASEKVNRERAGGSLHIHCELMWACCCLHSDLLNLLQ